MTTLYFPVEVDLSARGLNAKETQFLQISLTAALALLGSITAMDLVRRALQVIKIGNSVTNV